MATGAEVTGLGAEAVGPEDAATGSGPEATGPAPQATGPEDPATGSGPEATGPAPQAVGPEDPATGSGTEATGADSEPMTTVADCSWLGAGSSSGRAMTWPCTGAADAVGSIPGPAAPDR